MILANHWPIGRDRDDTELVGRHKLSRLGLRGTRHTREFGVEPEVVLQSDRCQGLVFGLDLDALFGLDGLVHAFVVAAAGQNSSGVLINNLHLPVYNHIVAVFAEELFGPDGVIEERDQWRVRGLVEVFNA